MTEVGAAVFVLQYYRSSYDRIHALKTLVNSTADHAGAVSGHDYSVDTGDPDIVSYLLEYQTFFFPQAAIPHLVPK